MFIRLKNGSIIAPQGVPEERLRTTEERVMATKTERQIDRDKKLEEAVEEIKELSKKVEELIALVKAKGKK